MNRNRLEKLIVDPAIRALEPDRERDRRLPAQIATNEGVVAVPAAHALRSVQAISAPQRHPCNLLHEINQVVDGHQLTAAEIDGLPNLTLHDGEGAEQAIIDVHE